MAVGYRGRILKTTDGGNTWTTYSPNYFDVRDLSFPDKTTGYANMGNTVYKTVDSGNSWKPLILKLNDYSEDDALIHCQFFSADTGFVTVSNHTRAYMTYNGGTTWKMIRLNQYNYDYVNSLQFFNRKRGLACLSVFSQSIIMKTDDGGESWKQAWSSQYYGELYNKLHFADEKTGFASRYEKLFRTEDSAVTWKQIPGTNFTNIDAIFFLNPQKGFIADGGYLYKSMDGGNNWSRITITNQLYGDLVTIKFFNDRVGYVSADGGAVYKTTDGGDTWKLATKASINTIRPIVFASDSSVYIGGGNGAILKSDIRDNNIDPIIYSIDGTCKVTFSTAVTALYGTTDSIQFEYGINDFDHKVAAGPSKVNNTLQSVTASVSNLLLSTTYRVRLKYYSFGKYKYSDELVFRSYDKPLLPVITPTGNTTFCAGGAVTLNTPTNSGYQWYYNGVAISGANYQSISARQSGKYQLTRTVGCYTSDTASIQVTVNPLPAKPVITVIGNTMTSSALNGNQWVLNNSLIPGANGKQYTATSNGIYRVRATENGCTGPLSDSLNFVLGTEHFIIYPNPVHDKLVVQNNTGAPMSLQLTNVDGNIILMATSPSATYTINMKGLAPGIYFIKTRDNVSGDTKVKMVIKK